MAKDLDQFCAENPDVVEELKVQFPRIQFVSIEDQDQIFALIPAPRPILEKFMMDMDDRKKRLNAMEHFVAGCTKYPESSILWGMLQEMPGLVIPLSDHCARVSGMSLESDRKKL